MVWSILVRTMSYTIKETAEALGVSTRQVRRYIKAGKLQAQLVLGKYGEEYRIDTLPIQLSKTKERTTQPLDLPPSMVMDLVNSLREENRTLAGQLGVSQERIRNLEEQVKLLTEGKAKPWWARLFR